MATRAKRKLIYGPDLFREVVPPESRVPFEVSYWDLWFVVVLQNEFGGDWAQMADRFRKMRSPINSYYSERMLNHQVHLQKRMSEAGLSVEGLVGDVALLKSEKKRAKKHVLERRPDRSKMSEWMLHTPRDEFRARAMRGNWLYFSVSPAIYEDRVQRLFKKTLYTKGQTAGLSGKIEKFIEKNSRKASLELKIALHRVFLTVLIERMEQIDDSYGTVGDTYGEVFDSYMAFPRHELGMSPEDFWQDLVELLIWENYGLTYQRQPNLFKSLVRNEALLVETILRQQVEDLFEYELTYRAEDALTMLSSFCISQQKFDELIPLAKQMGSRRINRIKAMSKAAENHQRPKLALAIYEAALGPGRHEKYLREEYNRLKERIG